MKSVRIWTEIPCDLCHGDRLSAESLAVTVGGLNIADFCKMSVIDALDFVGQLKLTEKELDYRC